LKEVVAPLERGEKTQCHQQHWVNSLGKKENNHGVDVNMINNNNNIFKTY
jgi:hypothetical protein